MQLYGLLNVILGSCEVKEHRIIKMKIIQLTENKKQYIDLLLLADEQESMIDRYLDRGDMVVLDDNGVKAICVITDETDGVCGLRNIAVTPESQRQGYGKRLINYLVKLN